MNKTASYKIFPELKLIIEYFSGNISINEPVELKKREVKDKYFDPNFSFIISISDVDIELLNLKAANNLVDIIKENKKNLGTRRSAIITTTSQQVVVSTLYQIAAKELPMNFKVVSTVNAALEWILLPEEYESFIIENIELLKNNTALNIK